MSYRRRRPISRRRLLAAAAGLALVLPVTACAQEPAVEPEPTPTIADAVPGDGVLALGVMVSTTGAHAAHALATVAGAELAVREINEGGGIAGAPLQLFHRAAGDETTDRPETALAELVARGIDAVIGPSSPELAERLQPAAEAAGVALSTATLFGAGAAASDDAFAVRVRSMDPAVADTAYAAEAYDAVIVSALAAVIAGNDSADAMTRFVTQTTGGEVPCSVYAECLEAVDAGFSIDYRGVSAR